MVGPTALTAADYQEIDAFFRERRKQNDKNPAVRAIRQLLADKKTKAQREPVSVRTTNMAGGNSSGCSARGITPRAGVSAATAAAKKTAPAKKKN